MDFNLVAAGPNANALELKNDSSRVGSTDDLGGASDFSAVSSNTDNCAIDDGVAPSDYAASSDSCSGDIVYSCVCYR